MALLLCGGAALLAWRARPWAETQAPRQLAWGVLLYALASWVLPMLLWKTTGVQGSGVFTRMAGPTAAAAGACCGPTCWT